MAGFLAVWGLPRVDALGPASHGPAMTRTASPSRANGLSLASLLLVQAIGLAVALALVAVTFASHDWLEARLQAFAVSEVEEAATSAWEVAGGDALAERAERLNGLAERFGIDVGRVDDVRERVVSTLIADILADRCIEGRRFEAFAATMVDTALIQRAADLRVGQSTLGAFIAGRYESTVEGLVTDIRRFGLVTAAVFALAMAAVLVRRIGGRRTVAFSVGLTGYTLFAAHGYVFGQDWARTILFQDWAGPAYQAGMIFVALVLVDWVFLRAIVTRFVTNLFGAAVSSIG